MDKGWSPRGDYRPYLAIHPMVMRPTYDQLILCLAPMRFLLAFGPTLLFPNQVGAKFYIFRGWHFARFIHIKNFSVKLRGEQRMGDLRSRGNCRKGRFLVSGFLGFFFKSLCCLFAGLPDDDRRLAGVHFFYFTAGLGRRRSGVRFHGGLLYLVCGIHRAVFSDNGCLMVKCISLDLKSLVPTCLDL